MIRGLYFVHELITFGFLHIHNGRLLEDPPDKASDKLLTVALPRRVRECIALGDTVSLAFEPRTFVRGGKERRCIIFEPEFCARL